jgi:VIT1/CCC1 family predicted Fe2+/Mn2+ transporter
VKREYHEIVSVPEHEREEIREIFYEYGLSKEEIEPILRGFDANHDHWVDFMMRFELGLEKPDRKRAPKSAATIAVSYLAGGVIPLAPYLFDSNPRSALLLSALLTGISLLIFGYVKSKFIGSNPFKGALKTAMIGGIAAAAAYAIARVVGG